MGNRAWSLWLHFLFVSSVNFFWRAMMRKMEGGGEVVEVMVEVVVVMMRKRW